MAIEHSSNDCVKVVRGYGRASTDKQLLSPSQQEAVVKDAFDLFVRVKPEWQSATWGGFFFDEATHRDSKFREREVGSLVLAATQPGDAIIVSNFDRIFAKVADVCETLDLIQQRKFRLVVLDLDTDLSSDLGQCFFKVMAAIKELEVKATRSRTRNALQHRRNVGLPAGRHPLGWSTVAVMIKGKVRRYYVPNEEQRALGRKILDLQVRRGLNFKDTMKLLNQLGIKNPQAENYGRRQSGKWTPHAIAKWLRAAQNNFPLRNGSHVPFPIPPEAEPVPTNFVSAD